MGSIVDWPVVECGIVAQQVAAEYVKAGKCQTGHMPVWGIPQIVHLGDRDDQAASLR